MKSHQVLSGLGWSASATVVSALGQIVFVAVLARLLDPAAFGLMAMASLSLRFAGVFSQGGFSQALVQQQSLKREETSAAFFLTLMISSSLYLLIALAAPLFAQGLRSPELTALIQVLGGSLVLGSMASLPLALLRRQARFKRVAAIELFSFIVGYGAVGMACASQGMGVWSLVAAALCQQALLLLLGFGSVRYPLTWRVTRSTCGRVWLFGSRYTVVGFLEFLFSNLESFFIGRQFGKAALGSYNRALMLTTLPIEVAVSAVTKVLFPALATLQNEPRRMADGFQILLLAVGLFATALACGIAAAADDVVLLLLGSKWIDTAPLVSLLAFAVPLAFMYTACGVTLDSLAALKPKLKLQAASLLAKLILVLWMAQWGLMGVAAAVVLAEALRLALGLGLLAHLLAIKPSRLVGLLALFVGLGLTVTVAVGAAATATLSVGLPLLARVAVETLMGSAALLICLLLLTLRFPRYEPLQQFESVRRWHAHWHASLLQALQLFQLGARRP